MVYFKEGVAYDTAAAESLEVIDEIIRAADSVYTEHEKDVTVTSLMDGNHKRGSKHYIGHAVDLRIWGIPEMELEEIVSEIQIYLGDDFDVILEKTHIHCEYDPK